MNITHVCALMILVFSYKSSAEQVDYSYFSTNSNVTTFDSFSGYPTASYQSLSFDGNDYSVAGSLDGVSVGTFPLQFTFSGNALFFGTKPVGTGVIYLAVPVSAAGIWVSASFGDWSIRGEFFDRQSTLIGSTTVHGSGFKPQFLGYSSENRSIQYVHFVDSSVQRNGFVVDDFYTKPMSNVPEPELWVTFAFGFFALGSKIRASRFNKLVSAGR